MTSISDTGTHAASRKPRDDELDVFGLTHPGKVRQTNQDHFLFSTLHKTLRVRTTSLADPGVLEVPSERLGSMFMVADGVGGSEDGEAASRATLETMAAYTMHTMHCYYDANPATDHGTFLKELEEAATACHETVVARAREKQIRKMATTLTLGLAVWPHLYLLHVGDSRAYRFRGGRLTQLTVDQTMAQALLDAGALKQADLSRSPLRNILSSAIGGTSQPVVTHHDLEPGDVIMLCTDGLTKHVPHDQIEARFRAMTSSEQVCRQLVDDALEGGGSDNVTVLVSRTVFTD
ncbi:MAG TPA: protein phosphatase 2C domain-containing protein [Gemmatimonadales bacterium]|nr:protein phosphatase 2C domain-containing protein [Gemmatimonadales bacterium]